MPGGENETVTLAVATPKPVTLAVIVTEPAVTPVTGTFTVVAFAAKLTADGTVATAALLELRLALSPAEAGPDKTSVRF